MRNGTHGHDNTACDNAVGNKYGVDGDESPCCALPDGETVGLARDAEPDVTVQVQVVVPDAARGDLVQAQGVVPVCLDLVPDGLAYLVCLVPVRVCLVQTDG